MLKVMKVLALGLLVPLAIAVTAPGMSLANSYVSFERVAGETCNSKGKATLASLEQVRSNVKAACEELGEWDIARLADGASLSGRGYKCEIKVKDDRKLGDALCSSVVSKSPFGVLR